MPPTVLLGLGAALSWGTADFFGGLLARRLPSLTIALLSQLAGGLTLFLLLLVADQRPVPEAVAWGAAAGIFSGIGVLCLYRGMAVGLMSVVAPVSACGAILPVIASLALGESPGWVAGLGVLAALAGIVLVSLPPKATARQVGHSGQALVLALAAALGFGMFFVLVDRGAGPGGSTLWLVLGTRAGSLPALLAIAGLARQAIVWPGRRLLTIVALGWADIGANAMFAYASIFGNLGVAAVLGSLYPVATLLLARLLLRERLLRPQAAGVSLALGGVALIAAG